MRSFALTFALGAALASCGDADAGRPPVPSAVADAATDVGKPSSDAARDGLLADAGCATCVGATMPTWQLTDFQPKSPGYGKTYGLEAFKGKVTVVALLASW